MIRDPSEVIGEFHAFRGEGLAVNEINQAVAVMQVVDEAEAALRIAHRNQVFKEADLHVGSFEEHAWVPVEFRAGFHKECIEFWSLLFDSYREPEVSGADADPDDVADGIFVGTALCGCLSLTIDDGHYGLSVGCANQLLRVGNAKGRLTYLLLLNNPLALSLIHI